MSMPPQGGWQPPQQPGSMPPNEGQPYHSPGPVPQQSYTGQQPPGYPPTPWPQHATPRQQGNGVKWLLIGVGLLLVIAITIGATLLFTRDSGGTPTETSVPPTSGASDDIASADDTGPVAIITAEPTCDAWNGIRTALASTERNGWDQRDRAAQSSEWTPAQRSQTEAVATAMRNAADQVVVLARQTPHRVIRELYEQFIAYGRAYADSIATYTPSDDFLAGANASAHSALGSICDAIAYGSAASRSLAAGEVPPPTQVSAPGNPANSQRFLVTPQSTCVAWVQREDTMVTDTAPWKNLDPNIPASAWTPEQRAIQEGALVTFATYADAIEASGRQSDNPILEDFAVLAAVYLRAYASTAATYIPADNYLSEVGLRLSGLISSACRAAAG